MNFSKPNKLFAFLIFILLFALTACGSTSSGDASEEADNSSSQETTDDGEETITLSYNVTFPKSQYDYEPKVPATETFKKRVEEETNGRVKIDLYYSSQLVDSGQMMDAISAGTVDMGTANPALYGDMIPTSNAINLPFWSDGEDQALELLNGEFGEIYERDVESHGVKVLFHWASDSQPSMSKDPVTSIDDLKGKLYRIESGYLEPWYEKLGMAPVDVDPVDLYTALQRGTIDGVFFSFYTIDSYKLHEVIDHVTVPGLLNPINVTTWINLDTWNKIPSDLQEIIEKVAKEVEKEAAEASKEIYEINLEKAKEYGVEVHELSEEELDRFKESSQIVWEEVADINEDTARMVEILREHQK